MSAIAGQSASGVIASCARPTMMMSHANTAHDSRWTSRLVRTRVARMCRTIAEATRLVASSAMTAGPRFGMNGAMLRTAAAPITRDNVIACSNRCGLPAPTTASRGSKAGSMAHVRSFEREQCGLGILSL